VLVVEDNFVNQQVAKLMLESLGYSVNVVANGLEALHAIASNHYVAVLMDCQMPGMDGYEATRQVRLNEQSSEMHLPIIAVTAHAMAGDAEKCAEAGMDDYLAKPVRLNDLQGMMERWSVLPS
jgi:CheY-like chemotaxis protein